MGLLCCWLERPCDIVDSLAESPQPAQPHGPRVQPDGSPGVTVDTEG
jgi:hypothetical protein